MSARVHKFTWCTESPCKGCPSEPHLVVEHKYVNVKQGAAVALSYIWGLHEPRKGRTLGHDVDGNAVQMELGEDWDLTDFKRMLHKTCSEPQHQYGCEYIWIDQLRKDKSSETTKQTLDDFPIIYSNFDVLVFLPGGLCGCWEALNCSLNSGDVSDIGPVARLTRNLSNRTLLDLHTTYASSDYANWFFHSLFSNSEPLTFNLENKREKDFIEQLRQCIRCINNAGFLSWCSRVWTRQELFGSRFISARFISESKPCPTPFIQNKVLNKDGAEFKKGLGSLMRPASLRLREWIREISKTEVGYNLDRQRQRDEAFQAMQNEIETGFKQAYMDLLAGRSAYGPLSSLRFLTGHCLASDGIVARTASVMNDPYQSDNLRMLARFGIPPQSSFSVWRDAWNIAMDSAQLSSRRTSLTAHNFLTMLLGYGRISFRATQAKDYVLALWISYTDYEVPFNSREMRLRGLVQDVITNFEGSGRMLLTTAPAGLFGKKADSARWSPPLYLQDDRVSSSKDVYGALFAFERLFLQASLGPLNLLAKHKFAEHGYISSSKMPAEERKEPNEQAPRNLVACSEVLGSRSTTEAIAWLRGIINGKDGLGRWSNDTIFRLGRYRLENRFRAAEADFCKVLASLLEASDQPSTFTHEYEDFSFIRNFYDTLRLPLGDDYWYDFIAGLVSVATGLPRDLAKTHGLQVYFEERADGLCRIGLFSADFRPHMSPVTIQMTLEATNGLFYEAVRLDGTTAYLHENTFRVVGVWVPYVKASKGLSENGYSYGRVLETSDAPYIVHGYGQDAILV